MQKTIIKKYAIDYFYITSQDNWVFLIRMSWKWWDETVRSNFERFKTIFIVDENWNEITLAEYAGINNNK